MPTPPKQGAEEMRPAASAPRGHLSWSRRQWLSSPPPLPSPCVQKEESVEVAQLRRQVEELTSEVARLKGVSPAPSFLPPLRLPQESRHLPYPGFACGALHWRPATFSYSI